MSLPKKCLVDTNVPKTANLATRPDADSDVSDACVLACVEAVEHVIKMRGLIIDAGDEIFVARARGQCNTRGVEKATRPAILFGCKTRGAKWHTVA